MNRIRPSSSALALALLTDRGATATQSAAQLGAAADGIWKRLENEFARLIGDAGVRAVMDRSISIATAQLPWLVVAPDHSLHAAFAGQPVDTGVDGLGHLVTTFIVLLGRFIGDLLVMRMLSEMWPAAFPSGSKESP